jgi:hypothetical protein
MIDVDRSSTLETLLESDLFGVPGDPRFDELARMSIDMFGIDFAAIAMVGPESVWFQSRHGIVSTHTERANSFCEAAILSDEMLVVEDVTKDPRFAAHPAVVGAPGIRFFAGQPFHSPDGDRSGVYCIFATEPRHLDSDKRKSLQGVGQWIEGEFLATDELDRAAEMQRALLPKNAAPISGYQVAGTCIPAKTIGGDFFDWYPIDGGLGFTLGDVMGKGASAGILAATVRAVVRSAARKKNVTVAVERTSTCLATDFGESSSFVTLFHARLRASDGRVSFVDAGHGLTAIVRADGTTQRLWTSDFPLGVMPDEHWSRHTVMLDPGDMLVTFSDGVLDLYDGTLNAIDEVGALARASTSPQNLVDTVEKLAKSAAATDDVTILVLRRDPE